MGNRYSLIPSATYIPRSPHEILVKGGALEGFSLVIDDPSRRGVAARIVAELQHEARSVEELSVALRGEVTPEDLGPMLDDLESGGAIMRIDDDSLPEADAAWTTFIRYGQLPNENLLSELTVVAQGDPSPFLSVAESWGVPLHVMTPGEMDLGEIEPAAGRGPDESEGLEPADASSGGGGRPGARGRGDGRGVVYLGEFSERTELMAFNQEAVRRGIPVLYGGIDGSDYTVGPFVVPGKTACMWETERQWARASADREQYETLVRIREREGAGENSSPGDRRHIAVESFAATVAPALLELSLRGTSGRGGVVLHGRATTSELSDHSVMRLPRCPVCMPMQPMARNPLY